MDPANRPALSVVAPCFDEEGVLPEFLRRVGAVLDGIGGTSEIVLVDDGSRDGTWEVMTEAAARDPRIVAVRLMRNHGHQLALTAGLTVCRGERILIIDADLQDPPELLPDMMALMDRGRRRGLRPAPPARRREPVQARHGRGLLSPDRPHDRRRDPARCRRLPSDDAPRARHPAGDARAPPLHPRHGGVDRRQAGADPLRSPGRARRARASIRWPRWCASPPTPSPPSRWCR